MKDIKGYEGLYAITSCGKVWSYKTKKFLKPAKDRDGYSIVSLYKNGNRKTKKVHRLVAEAYIPNPDNLPQVNHKNEIKSNNWIGNLEWCSAQYNTTYSQGVKVKCIENGKIYASQSAAALDLGLNQGNISKVCRGLLQSCNNLHFELVEEGSDI